MNYEQLLLPNWNKLAKDEKINIFNELIDKQKKNLKLLSVETFSLNGLSIETGVFDLDGSQFVYVPGNNNINLGWNLQEDYMDEQILTGFKDFINEWGLGCELEDYFYISSEDFSPVRQASIKPMFVERSLISLGDKENYELTYEDAIKPIIENGFSIPTEDEYEYLCGAGIKSLFKFGHKFESNMKLAHYDSENTLEEPNMFGLHIAYDPYYWELVLDDRPLLKGGDGGRALCGDCGLILGYLSTSPYYRSFYTKYIRTEFTFARRIIRIDNI